MTSPVSICRKGLCAIYCFAVVLTAFSGQRNASAQEMELHTQPNYQQASQYSSSYIRQFLYSTSVTPNWIGKTDKFWYSYKDSKGTHYFLVDPKRKTKGPLFDSAKLAPQLSVMVKKPLDASRLSLTRVEVDDNVEKMKFVSDSIQYEFDLNTEKLVKLGKPPRRGSTGLLPASRFSSTEQYRRYLEFMRRRGNTTSTATPSSSSASRTRRDHRNWAPDRRSYVFAKGHNLYYVEVPESLVKKAIEDEKKKKARAEARAKAKAEKEAKEKESKDADKSKTEDKKESGKKEADKKDSEKKKSEEDKSKSANDDKDGEKKDDDKKDGDKKEEDKSDEKKDANDDASDEKKEDSKELPIPKATTKMDDKAIQLTKDGKDGYSFVSSRRSFRGRAVTSTEKIRRSTIKDDTKSRPTVSWSKDSKSFYVYRRDSRDIQELWVINSLTNPRPTLEAYKYPMPGEDKIYKTELYIFTAKSKKLNRVEPKWKDESYSNVHFTKDNGKLKFMRKDRLLRNVELCTLDLASGKSSCLIEEGFQNANLSSPTVRYMTETDEMIWWSERSGWGHFYLYDRNGEFKNAITSGPFRASSIVSIDEKNRTLYFRGNGQLEEENVYFEHLYSVRFDGSGLKLLDPGNANHRSSLSPSKNFIVDNCSRVDMAPRSLLRDINGELVMELEEADLSRLYQVGWSMPDTFKVKAADGVTDLYGNMWKPFDFNPKKKYPIILHVYPGPQTEGTRHTFSATVGEQQLAQVGFIVIQVGHRGGAPTRSKAYGAYGYFNLRDYGLADKKAAVEQLAARHKFIDINRVGLYGHSGGGFMTAAAMLRAPYNDFFKVGVSTAGNHDNNIYNNSWSERYHGLKEVDEKSASKSSTTTTSRTRSSRSAPDVASLKGMVDVEASDHFYEFEYFDDDFMGSEALWNEGLPIPWDKEDKTKESKDDDALKKAKQGSDKRVIDRKKSRQKSQDEKKDSDNKKSDDKKSDDKKSQEKSLDKKSEDKKSEDKKSDDKKSDDKKSDDKKSEDKKSDDKKSDGKKDEEKKDGDKKDGDKKDEKKSTEKKFKKKFDIHIPTNAELAGNLKGHLFLIHGELDNNVHPANTLRLVDALIKANKRFDMLYLPAKRHSFGSYQPYVTQRMYEYFAEHLLNDYQDGADINEKKQK